MTTAQVLASVVDSVGGVGVVAHVVRHLASHGLRAAIESGAPGIGFVLGLLVAIDQDGPGWQWVLWMVAGFLAGCVVWWRDERRRAAENEEWLRRQGVRPK